MLAPVISSLDKIYWCDQKLIFPCTEKVRRWKWRGVKVSAWRNSFGRNHDKLTFHIFTFGVVFILDFFYFPGYHTPEIVAPGYHTPEIMLYPDFVLWKSCSYGSIHSEFLSFNHLKIICLHSRPGEILCYPFFCSCDIFLFLLCTFIFRPEFYGHKSLVCPIALLPVFWVRVGSGACGFSLGIEVVKVLK